MGRVIIACILTSIALAGYAAPGLDEAVPGLDDADADSRQAFLNGSHQLRARGDIRSAFMNYLYSVQNWHLPDQQEDLREACQHLYLLAHAHGVLESVDEYLGSCPTDQLDYLFGRIDRDYSPINIEVPIYPLAALLNDDEGWVILEHDITPDGKTENVRAIDYSDSVFVRAAIKAIERSTYLHRIENGVPVRVKGTRTKVTFRKE